ncbi:MAG TPA: hypothetical protein VGD88_03510 [Opitutaceae bacterium]
MRGLERIRPWLPRLAALAVVLLFAGLMIRLWHPAYGFTAFLQLNAENDDLKIAAFHDPSIYVHRDTGGYDGLYYAQIAYDPLLKSDELLRAMDNLSYRARRILPPVVAWIVALGQPEWIVHIYASLNLVAWAALALLLWRLLGVSDIRGWLAWAGMMLSAGTLNSVRLALSDLPMVTLIAASMLAVESGRLRASAGWLAAAALARETAVLGLAALVERPWLSRRNVRIGLVVAIPLACWLAYIRWQVGPANQGFSNLTLPGSGFVEKWTEVLSALRDTNDPILAWTTVLATLGLTVQAVFILTRWRKIDDRWWRLGAAYTGLMLILNTAVWEGFPGASMRVLLPLTLAFNVLAFRTRASIVWLLLGNVGVASGLLALRDLPYSRELDASRAQGAVSLVEIQSGWSAVERNADHTWSWGAEQATLALELRSDRPRTGVFSGELHSLVPRTVIISHAGRELWRGRVDGPRTPFSIPLALTPGDNPVVFTTDTPAVTEGDGPGARRLAFALYDAQLALNPP